MTKRSTADGIARKIKALGVTQESLARLWNCSTRTVQRKLSEEGTITLYELWSIADAYGFSVSECVWIITRERLTAERLFKEVAI